MHGEMIPAGAQVDSQAPSDRTALRFRCECGGDVAASGASFSCRCGRPIGQLADGVVRVGEPTPYWGEISQDKMRELIAMGERLGWREAVELCLPNRDRGRILDPMRAAFQDVLSLRKGSRILDIGAGMGLIATELARTHHVVALEGVWERARLMALRKQQDGLENLTVVNGDLNSTRLTPGQFDCIIVNGVLEWVGLFDLTLPPEQVQQNFLKRLADYLAPGGIVYLAIENRFGWLMFLGREDHSGLKYTSLMPRFLARWVCSRRNGHRADSNIGYRTYTYSYWGYLRLFRRVGLRPKITYSTWYTMPTEMTPISAPAIQAYTYGCWVWPAITWGDRVRNVGKRLFAHKLLWHAFTCDFAFILEKRS